MYFGQMLTAKFCGELLRNTQLEIVDSEKRSYSELKALAVRHSLTELRALAKKFKLLGGLSGLARLDGRDKVRSARYQADTFQFHRYEDKMTQLSQSNENHTLDMHR